MRGIENTFSEIAMPPMRLASGVMAVVLGIMALLQYNDPEPILWMTIYGVVALCSALYGAGYRPTVFTHVLAAICVLGVLYLTGQILIYGSFLDETGREMMGLTETAREALGLSIAAGWTVVLATWESTKK